MTAHEPPLTELLPDSDPRRQTNQEIHETYLASGPEAAMGHFFAASGMNESGGKTRMGRWRPTPRWRWRNTLGVTVEVFPGDHVGMFTEPESFVERLIEVLRVQVGS